MNDTLRIATWNANGILNHIAEIETFLINEKIDILLISETHFVKTSYTKIRGFAIYHSIHPAEKARGGSAILIKENIKHYEEFKIEEDKMQVTSIKVHFKNKNTSINIAAIYCPPKHNLKKPEYAQLFKQLGDSFIIGGDYNAKNTFWGSRITSVKGKELYLAGVEAKCDFHSSGSPTYWPSDVNKIPDIIDFFITRNISQNYIEVENSEGLCSDHSPVIMTVSETIIKKATPPKLTNRQTNWNRFKDIIEKEVNLQIPIRNVTELLQELEGLNQLIHLAASESTAFVKSERNINVSYPMEIRELIKEKRKARKTWQTTRSPVNKTILNNLCLKLKSVIKDRKNETLSKYLLSLTGEKSTEYSLWKATKHLKRPVKQMPPLKKDDGTWARSPQSKADLFADQLEKTFQPLPRMSTEENIIDIPKHDEEEIPPVTYNEIKEEIRNSLKNKKAPGFDNITSEVVKALPDRGVRKILHIINAAFRLKHVPKLWKVAEVIMIQKPNKSPSDKASYRPISLLPILSKLFEKLLLKRLKQIIGERNLIPSHQFGFRENHSTIEQVHRITNMVEEAVEEKKICTTIFLDVAQAFDKVWHQGLEYKLRRDLPRQYSDIMSSYISDRHFRVKIDNEYSTLRKIKAGVPQGSVLGPILYLLYTRDLPNPTDATIATFADDTAILAMGSNINESTNKVQCATDKIINWTKKWRTQLNESKSIHINFTYKNIHYIPVNINLNIVPYANTAKYLGMTLDAKLKWKEHVKKKKDELNLKFRKMYWLLGRNSLLSTENKLLLYRQVLKPVWTYGIQLWGCTKKSNVKIIQTFQNKVLRSIVNAPWYCRNDDIHRDLKMNTVFEEIAKHANKHKQRLDQHVNPEIQIMLNNPIITRRLNRNKPSDLVT